MKTKDSVFKLVAFLVGCATTVGAFGFAPNTLASGGPGGGGESGGGGGISTIANVLRGPWESLGYNTILTAIFNNDGTFTTVIESASGAMTSDTGRWTLSAPVSPRPFSNPQAHVVLTDSQGIVLLPGDVLIINNDQLAMFSATNSVSTVPIISKHPLTELTI